MRRRTLRISVVVLLGLFIHLAIMAHEKGHSKKLHAHWSAPPEAAKRPNPIQRDQESIARGKKLFQTHCVVCHGPGGKGDGPAAAGLNPKPPNLVKMAGHHPDGDIAWKIENGRGTMPVWKGKLKEKEIWNLTNFIQALPSELTSR